MRYKWKNYLCWGMIFWFFPVCGLASSLKIQAPKLWVSSVPFTLELENLSNQTRDFKLFWGEELIFQGKLEPKEKKELKISIEKTGKKELILKAQGEEKILPFRQIPGLLSIIPPLLAIGLSLIFRQVLASLWLSIFVGALIVFDYKPLSAFARTIDYYLLNSMAGKENSLMLLFILFMGGLVGVISKGGGIHGLVEKVSRWATSARRGQFATWLLGLFIFFDDYANTIIVGNAMRPITDKLRISREKLSYLVDTTAAPVASIFPISTWIGYEVGLINSAFQSLGIKANGFLWFLQSIPYRFYPIFSLIMLLFVIALKRDLGPMHRAESRARKEGKVLRDNAQPMANLEPELLKPVSEQKLRWYNALVPILTVIIVTFVGLWFDGVKNLGVSGYQEFLKKSQELGPLWGKIYLVGMVYSQAGANTVLSWASLCGGALAVVMVLSQRIMNLAQAMDAWLGGAKSMVIAVLILLFAWGLGSVCAELHTAEWITHQLKGVLNPRLVPVLVFMVACLISFSTGTSYGTMAILIPLVIPIAHHLSLLANFNQSQYHIIMVGAISSVLAGAVFGDHCSPISDTTIMSSMASNADHIDHVRTQLPYALTVAGMGMLVGDIPTAYGMPPWASWIIGSIILLVILVIFGKKIE